MHRASSPMSTQEEGIASRERDVFENAEFPILVSDFGKSSRSRREQPRNDPSPMDSRAQPSFAARRFVQRANASAPMDVSESGRETRSRARLPPFDAIAVSCLVGAVYGSCLKREMRSRVIHVSQGGHAGRSGDARSCSPHGGGVQQTRRAIPPPSHCAARRRGRGKGCCSFFPSGRLRQCLLTHLGLRLSVDFVPAYQGKQLELPSV